MAATKWRQSRIQRRMGCFDLQSMIYDPLSSLRPWRLGALAVNLSCSLREDDIGVGAVAEEIREEFEEEGVGFLDET